MKHRYWIGLGIVLLLVVSVGGVLLTELDLDGHTTASYLDVSPAESDDSINQTVAFSNLSPAQQRAFKQALNDEDNYVQIPDGVDEQVWIENRAVRYQNRTYEVFVAVS